jgi:hypothetical protein
MIAPEIVFLTESERGRSAPSLAETLGDDLVGQRLPLDRQRSARGVIDGQQRTGAGALRFAEAPVGLLVVRHSDRPFRWNRGDAQRRELLPS